MRSVREIKDFTAPAQLKRIDGCASSKDEQREFRNALGGFATGVTVILAKTESGFHGMTANSFSAVSLDPALVLVSISNEAKAARAIQSAKQFSVNLLSSDQMDISGHFAGKPIDEERIKIEWTEAETPILTEALGIFDCRVSQVIQAGDHTIFLGEVKAFKRENLDPLLFFGGRYGRFNENIKLAS